MELPAAMLAEISLAIDIRSRGRNLNVQEMDGWMCVEPLIVLLMVPADGVL